MKNYYPAPPIADQESLTSLGTLLEFLEGSAEELGWVVNLVMLSSSRSLENIFEKWGTVHDSKRLNITQPAWVLYPQRHLHDHQIIQWFIIEYSPGIVLLISTEHRDLIHAPINKWIQRYRPLLAPALLSTPTMRRIFNSVSQMEGTKSKVMLDQVSWKGKLPVPTTRKFLESNRLWTERPFDQVFDDLRDQKKWATSVHFSFAYSQPVNNHPRQVQGALYRNGEITSTGCLSSLFNSVIDKATEEIIIDRKFFSKRGSEDSPTGQFKPLVIQYDEPVFADKTQNYLLIKVIESIPKTGVSILHPNPYLHAAVVDYIDGSTYDIWVVHPNRINIVPKVRATAASLERICAHVCVDFRDGDIWDYEEVLTQDTADNDK